MRKIAMDRVDIGKLAIMTVFANAFQILSALFIAILVTINPGFLNDIHIKLIMYLVLVVISIGGFYDIREALAARKVDEKADALEISIDHLEEMNGEMRKQRHDFMNHLQVVYSLIEMNEAPEALRYIENVHTDLARIGKSLKTSIPALNALISAKGNDAQEMNIAFSWQVKSSLEGISLESWEICRITGNLIDNAFDALSDINHAYILVEISENENAFIIAVSNNGPCIEQTLLDRICEAGFSTKGENRGMGLSIVNEIASKAGGGVYVASTPEKTIFRIEIPKKQQTM